MNNLQKKAPNRTFGYYEKIFPEEIRAIKEDLYKHVPVGETFKHRLDAAKRCFITTRSLKRKRSREE